MPEAEELTDSEEAFLKAMISGDVPEIEASDAGRKYWAAFHTIRDAAGRKASMSISEVATRAGCARGPLATKGGRFRILREAIRRRCLLERPKPAAVEKAAPAKSDEERRLERVRHWQARARQSDSLNAAYLARALKAEKEAANEKVRSKRFLAELNANDPDMHA
jgi:hypothetical protein